MRLPSLKSAAALGILLASAACREAPVDSTADCKGRQPGDLVITEVMADPDGPDEGREFIEFYNSTDSEISLRGMTLTLGKTDGGTEKTAVLRAGVVAGADYIAIGDVRDAALPEHIGYSYENALGSLGNSNGVLTLRCGETVLDQMTYTTAAESGHSLTLNGDYLPDAKANDDEQLWCGAPQPFGTDGKSFGSPGKVNDSCGATPLLTCLEGSLHRAIQAPEAGSIVITEVMANPLGDDNKGSEWIELFVTRDTDLNGLVLTAGTTENPNPSKSIITSDMCIMAKAGSYLVLARRKTEAADGDVSNAVATFSVSLPNKDGVIRLLAGEIELDSVAYENTVDGKSRALNGDYTPDSLVNDDVSLWCEETSSYFSEVFGTPGEPNSICAPPNSCLDNGAMRPIESPKAGDLIISELMADPTTVTDAMGEWIEIYTKTAVDLNGVALTVGNSSTILQSPNCLRMTANSHVLLAHNTNPEENGGLPEVFTTFPTSLPQAGAKVTLSLGPDELDSFTYTTAVTGRSTQVDATKLTVELNDANQCPGADVYPAGRDGSVNYGTPGAANRTCPPPTNPNECMDPSTMSMRARVTPAEGELVITEFLADPKAVSDTAGEYIEVLVTKDLDLNGVFLANESTSGVPLSSSMCLRKTAGTYLLFGRNELAASNGGLPALDGVFSFGLGNSSARSLSVRHGTTVIDTVTYSTATNGASSQLNPTLLDATSNDTTTNFCATPVGTIYGAGDRGTPGAANVACM